MNVKLLRLLPVLAAVLAVAGASAIAASAASSTYCDPLGGCKKPHFVKVSPRTVKAGNGVTVSGAVGNGCKRPGQVTIYSRAFKHATTHQFAGVPAILTRTNRSGKFSKRITIKRSIKPGRYHVGARCGGGNFGSATLKVTRR